MIEESVESFTSGDLAAPSFWNPIHQRVAQALMSSLQVVVLNIIRDSSPTIPLTEEHQSIEAFRLDRENDPLGLGIQIRAPRRASVPAWSRGPLRRGATSLLNFPSATSSVVLLKPTS